MRRVATTRIHETAEIAGFGKASRAGNRFATFSAAVRKPLNWRTDMLTILFILLVLALVGGGLGHSRFGYAGWSPAGILIVILLVMFFTGNRL